MSDLSGAVVVVTGAATGVGRALAREAAGRGADVVAVDVDDPGETTELIAAAGGRARRARADVRDLAALQALAEELGGPVDLVCANAGTGAGGTIDTIKSDDLRHLLEVNVLGVFHTAQAFLPGLRLARAAGRPAALLITGSEHSLGVPPYVPPMTGYTTTKHALLGLAAAFRRDLAPEDIAVSLLCPGYVRTERLRAYASASTEMRQVLDAYGQDSADVAGRALDGVARGAFLIPTNPVSRDFVVEFHQEVIDAMEEA
jgi:NAD(P)-dependent dehydrogenase (short-subunit alcohol dehydrogenase family)